MKQGKDGSYRKTFPGYSVSLSENKAKINIQGHQTLNFNLNPKTGKFINQSLIVDNYDDKGRIHYEKYSFEDALSEIKKGENFNNFIKQNNLEEVIPLNKVNYTGLIEKNNTIDLSGNISSGEVVGNINGKDVNSFNNNVTIYLDEKGKPTSVKVLRDYREAESDEEKYGYINSDGNWKERKLEDTEGEKIPFDKYVNLLKSGKEKFYFYEPKR